MAGMWQALTHQPAFNASTMLLLTDGTIMCQDAGGASWWKLTPDGSGNYMSGTWSALAPMHNTRLYYASAVLADGRVFVAGGEYSNAGSETNAAEIYDPVLDTWTPISAPPGWAEIGDAACCVLPDGRVMLGNLDDTRTAFYDPTTNTWTAGPNKGDSASEETWTLLPDETVLAVQCRNHPNAEKYVEAANAWVSAGATPGDLVEGASIEIGPAFLLPDGRAFCIGATNRTAIYSMPPIANQPGHWTAGPTFPNDPMGRNLGAKDAPGCLMPNGKVLCVVGPVDGVFGDFLGPTSFFEFDGSALHRVPDPPNAGGPPFVGRMMLTPQGQVLFATGTHALYAYIPDGAPDPAWRPHITSCPTTLNAFSSYTLQGRQLNGLSQAVGYGDDASSATNYPMVKLRNAATGHVAYCRTFNHSTMGVATGLTIQSTNFHVPGGFPLGHAQLCVVANGIESDCINVNIRPWIWHFPIDERMVNRLIGSLGDGPLWVLGPNGPVPVDPMAKDAESQRIAREAREARHAIVTNVRHLQKLGHEVAQRRAIAAQQLAPAMDPALATAVVGEAKEKSGVK
jgi:hypothetical protein